MLVLPIETADKDRCRTEVSPAVPADPTSWEIMRNNGRKRPVLARKWGFAGAVSALILCAQVGALTPTAAFAHDVNTSYVRVFVTPDSLRAIYTFPLAGLVNDFDVDRNGDGVITRAELAVTLPKVYALVAARSSISADFTVLDLVPRRGGYTKDPDGRFLRTAFAQQHVREFRVVRVKDLKTEDGFILVNAVLTAPLKRLPDEIVLRVSLFEEFSKTHITMAKIDVDGRIFQTAFTKRNAEQRFTIGKETSLAGQIAVFVQLGVEHIFLGYDHILFLLALIVIGGRFKQLLKIVTAFTVAHSVTLILSALEVVSLPPRLVEVGIALSIAYVALENFFVRKPSRRWVLTFFFGLIHGFGFANVLVKLGLPTRGLVASLFSFNVGVEIGQICIVAVLFPFIIRFAENRYQRRVAIAVSSAILFFGIGWFIERAFNFSFMPL